MDVIRKRRQLPDKPVTDNPDKKLLWEICEACWNYDPERRITVREIIDHLSRAAQKLGRETDQDISDGYDGLYRLFYESRIDFVEDHVGL